MRWPVEVVLDLVSSGMSVDEILADHPELEREDIRACLDFGTLPISFAASRRTMMLTGLMRP
jgi:uncharacterized protein (DUF433 family)